MGGGAGGGRPVRVGRARAPDMPAADFRHAAERQSAGPAAPAGRRGRGRRSSPNMPGSAPRNPRLSDSGPDDGAGAGAAGGGRCGSGGPIEPLDPRRGLLAGRHARRLAVARRHPAPARRIAAQIANAAGRRIAGGMPAARNVRITLPASARSRPGRAASRRSQGTAAAGSVNRRACGRRSKPAIASGCDPIPFRTWKSNLASLSCY